MYNIEDYKIDFIKETHEYFVNGVQKPCLSNINKDVLPSSFKDIPEFILKRAGQRGDAVHEMIKLDLSVGLDSSSIDDKLKGYWESYSLFKEGKVFEPKILEKPMYCPSLDYCFTLDFLGPVNGLTSLYDWKTGSVYDETKYKCQIGGQTVGVDDYGYLPCVAGCVQLYKNGKLGKLYEYDLADVVEDFRAVKRVYDLRRKA